MQVCPHRGRARRTACGSGAIAKPFPFPAPARVHGASFCAFCAKNEAQLFCGSRDLSPDLRKPAAVAYMNLRTLGGVANQIAPYEKTTGMTDDIRGWKRFQWQRRGGCIRDHQIRMPYASSPLLAGHQTEQMGVPPLPMLNKCSKSMF
jgi:hypothetical protein